MSLTGVRLSSSSLRPSSPDKTEISLTGVPDRKSLLKAVKPDKAEMSLTCVSIRSRRFKAVKLPMSGGSTAKSEKSSPESVRSDAPLARAVAMASCARA